VPQHRESGIRYRRAARCASCALVVAADDDEEQRRPRIKGETLAAALLAK